MPLEGMISMAAAAAAGAEGRARVFHHTLAENMMCGLREGLKTQQMMMSMLQFTVKATLFFANKTKHILYVQSKQFFGFRASHRLPFSTPTMAFSAPP